MTCKILVDVYIFQDVITKRKGWQASYNVLNKVYKSKCEGWINSLTKTIIYFLNVKKIGESKSRQLVSDLTRSFAEIPLNSAINKKALEADLPEYEDNIQIESASCFHMDAIITRNKKHFKQEAVPVYAPEEFIDLLNNNEKYLNLESSIPFLDLKAQNHQIFNEIDDRFFDIMANAGFILGKYVDEFEKGFAEIQDAKYCIGVSSGTDALHVALLSLGIGHGDLVIVPVNTFIATAEAVTLCGAKPVFADCDEYHNIDAEKLRKQIEAMDEANRIKLKAIIPVHLYGQPADMDAVMSIADQFGLLVVEDACQAHLAEYKGKKVGTLGKFGAFSFYPGKNLGAWGEAGALITNDEDLYLKVRQIRQHGEIVRYHHGVVGHNYRMSAFQGAVLSVKLKYIAEWTEKRQKNAGLYRKYLSNVAGIELPKEKKGCFSVYHLFVIQTDNREALQNYLQEKGIASGLHYPVPLHLQEAYKDLGHKKGEFSVAENAAERILSLPMYPELAEHQIKHVCEAIAQWRKDGG
jgi:dTDP-4-amino-4,6-dideoxygalactose transaminase